MGYLTVRNGSRRACRFCPAASASPAASCARRALRLHPCTLWARHALCDFQETADGDSDVYRCVQRLLELLAARDPPDHLALGFLRYREWNWEAAHAAFALAAESGCPAGQFSRAVVLESEQLRDSPGSRAAATRYYKRAAAQGFALAQFQLGVMTELGECETDDDDAPNAPGNAVSYYRAAGCQGLGVAWYYLASCYLDGVGVEQSLASARSYFVEAAAHGYVGAESEIAELDVRLAEEGVIAGWDSDSESATAVTRGVGLGYDSTCAVMFPDTESEPEPEDEV